MAHIGRSLLPGRRRRGRGLTAAADVIGIEVDELRTELHRGRTIADVARDHDVDPDDVVVVLTHQFRRRIEAEVRNGRLSRRDADLARGDAGHFALFVTTFTLGTPAEGSAG